MVIFVNLQSVFAMWKAFYLYVSKVICFDLLLLGNLGCCDDNYIFNVFFAIAYRIHVHESTVKVLQELNLGYKVQLRGRSEVKVQIINKCKDNFTYITISMNILFIFVSTCSSGKRNWRNILAYRERRIHQTFASSSRTQVKVGKSSVYPFHTFAFLLFVLPCIASMFSPLSKFSPSSESCTGFE